MNFQQLRCFEMIISSKLGQPTLEMTNWEIICSEIKGFH